MNDTKIKIPRPCDDCGKITDYYQHDWFSEICNKEFKITKCKECADKRDKIDEWQNEQFREDTMICPWCEIEFEAEDCIYEQEDETTECPYCGKVFEYEVHNEITWTTRKPEDLYEPEEDEE